ncbi:MAG: hypothetical protein ATN31_03340 [Candidatus Epulonipiscioides saccharophilum]|nr:MAG: hypothetical protein ATN31_03340 [Epulopiscium sp. AS2M-Bin001]
MFTELLLASSLGMGIGANCCCCQPNPFAIAEPTQIVSEKFEDYAHPESFISAQELHDLMQDESKDVIVIGTLDPSINPAPIKNSFTMWRDDYSAKSGTFEFEGMSNSTEEMEAILSSYGATPYTTIVVYAFNDHHDAGRLWWQIKLLGHQDVRYLDGGLNAWQNLGLPTGHYPPEVNKITNYVAPDPFLKISADLEDMINALNANNTVILDTRSAAEETGEITLDGAFGPGKIPDSIWLDWDVALEDDTTMKPLNELEEIYGDFSEKDIITYCQSGVRSAHTLFVLTQALGYENVKNYDGSWIEWSYEYYEKANPATIIRNGIK